eukprot:TRINITY_DN10310_c0_g1_i2.p2 TRINITY_DN10310_c0_g1~~TRINITY_DN10310_c0_g1_i2.p2  ORF type:complete len:124 (+),score=30.12 TRINITY_DN10310_c0_g1_i2:592-963(+)
MVKVKTRELRAKPKADLEKELKDLRTELAQLRVASQTGGATSKLAKIKSFRKSIARVLTVLTQQEKLNLRKFYAGKKNTPLDLRPKLTRKLRRALQPHEEGAQRLREKKLRRTYPRRVFAVRI